MKIKYILLLSTIYSLHGCATLTAPVEENKLYERNTPIIKDNIDEWKEWEQQQRLRSINKHQ